MPSRRPHQKTRHGCVRCKERRVKCDEQRPACRNCLKQSASCSLSTATLHGLTESQSPICGSFNATTAVVPLRPLSQPVNLFPAGSLPTSSIGLARSTLRDLHTYDHEMMHHYVTVTSLGLQSSTVKQRIWQNAVPQDALNHPYLMYGLIALSALHLSHTGIPNPVIYEDLAVRHQNLAVRLFAPALTNITPENCNAQFLLSMLLAVLSFAYPQFLCTSTIVENLMETFVLLRGGVAAIHAEAQKWLRHGVLGALFFPNDPLLWNAPYSESVGEDIQLALQRLHALNKAKTHEAADRELYWSTIEELSKTWHRLALRPGEWELVFVWPVIVDGSYLDLLMKKEPMALAILAHFCVTLKRAHSQWWTEGWGAQVVESIFEMLDEDWRPAVLWAREMISMDLNEPNRRIGIHSSWV